jgi:hypothetical protein
MKIVEHFANKKECVRQEEEWKIRPSGYFDFEGL